MSLIEGPTSTADELARAGGRQIRRYVNESLARAAKEARASEHELCDFLCECGQLSCTAVVRMPHSSFDESSEPGSIVAHGD